MKSNLSAVLVLLLGFIYSSSMGFASSPKGLKVALLGDSMTWIGGDSCENATGWSHILKESGIAQSIAVYARSGATWTNTSSTRKDISYYSELLHDDNVIYNQALRLIEDKNNKNFSDPDCIVIFAGANDAWFANRRPGIYDDDLHVKQKYTDSTHPSSVTSLYGSVTLVCDLLRAHFPESSLTIVTPIQMSKISEEITHKTSDIIEAAARSRNCIILRADNDVNILHEIESKSPTYTYDGVHTNPAGAILVAEFILSHLKHSDGH